MTIPKVQSNDGNDNLRFFLEAALVVAGIAVVTAAAKPLARQLFERNLPSLPRVTRVSSAKALFERMEGEEIIESALAKSKLFGLLMAPFGAAAGEALYQKNSALLFNDQPHYANTYTVGFWGLLGSINKLLVPLCNSGIAVTTSLTVGVLSLAYYCHYESDSNRPSIARDMGIAFFIGFATSAALRGKWALVG